MMEAGTWLLTEPLTWNPESCWTDEAPRELHG